MATLVAPLGLSPPVVTEFVQWLMLNGADLRRVVLMATREKDVLAGAKLVEVALRSRYPSLEVSEVLLDYQDVDDQDKAFDFLERVIEVLEPLRAAGKTYLLISGGRKVMSVSLALVSQFLPGEVYHVVMRDIKVINLKLEQLRAKIEELYESEDPLSYYRANEDLEELMFPALSEYEVIRLPTIPYPDHVLSEVKRALEGAKKGELEFNMAVLLSMTGLVQIAEGRTVATEMGRRVLRILERLV